MTLPGRPAPTSALQTLCLLALSGIAAPAAAQSGDTELFTLDQDRRVPPPADPAGGPPPTTLAELPPPPPEPRAGGARWSLGGGLSGSVFSIHYGPAAGGFADPHGNRGSVHLGPTVFLSRVKDDDAPRSLQPFFQRTSTVSADVRGGGFVTRFGDGGAFSRTDSYVGASASVDAYLSRNFALTGGFGYTYDVLHQSLTLNKGHAFDASAGFGVRIGDARLDASYTFNAYDVDGTFEKPRWGSVALTAFVVLARSFTLGLRGHADAAGGGAEVDLGYYATKDLGFSAGFSGRTFSYAATDVRTNYYTGSAGISHWTTPGTRLSCNYTFGYFDEPTQQLERVGYTQIEHTLSVNALARMP
jgi:hypothetical protein